ncbi:hypothetical protein TNCV_1322381 [Trichonephila clavipes]|nr:hypothetical protein TNCV_1322381 [Trichonephila clavipes]
MASGGHQFLPPTDLGRVDEEMASPGGDRLITKTTARLRTAHYTGINIDDRTYRNCDNCSDTEINLAHIFDCPTIVAAIEIGVFVNKPLCG